MLTIGTEQFGSGQQLRTLREITCLLANASAETVRKNAGDTSEDKHERAQIILEAELEVWNDRPLRTPTYPVECFLKAFRPSWKKCSDAPYDIEEIAGQQWAYSVEKLRNLKIAIFRKKCMVCESQIELCTRCYEFAQKRRRLNLVAPLAKTN